MPVAYRLTARLRARLKEPLGTLIRGSSTETMKGFKDLMRKEKPRFVIAVGDTVSENLERSHVFPKLAIVDNLAMRKRIPPASLTADRTLCIDNPQSTITDEAIAAIQESLKVTERTKIVVKGEEDLLALIAVLHAPENSLVVYGQPNEGIVVVKPTSAKKAEIQGMLELMEDARKAK